MGKIEEVVRSEITRLARKELRATVEPLAKEVRDLRRTVAVLTRTVEALERTAAEDEQRRLAEQAELTAPEEEVQKARFSPRLIKKLRSRLGLTQEQLAKVLGVSLSAVTFWELGRARPSAKNQEAIVALRKLGRRDVRKILEQAQQPAEE